MERVTGIGGLFFAAQDPAGLVAWYEAHLGVDPVPQSYGDRPWWQQAGPTAFVPMRAGAELFGGGGRSWAVNFRVDDLDAMVAQLRAASVEVDVDPEAYPIGRFASLRDPEGNVVQLWEPTEPARTPPEA